MEGTGERLRDRRSAGKGLAGEWHTVVVERMMRVGDHMGDWQMGMGSRLEEVGRYTGEFPVDDCLVGEWHMGILLVDTWRLGGRVMGN
jgi:hypothetical protein